MRRPHPIKRFSSVLAVLAIVGIVIAVYGMTRGDESAPAPRDETVSQKTALAQKLVAQGHPEKALQLLAELETVEGRKLDKQSRLLRLKAMDDAGMSRELAEEASSFLADYPETPEATEVRLLELSGQLASAGLGNPALVATIENFVEKHPEHPGVGRLMLALARHELNLGDRAAAQRRLNRAMTMGGGDPRVASEIRGEIGDLNLEAMLRGDIPMGEEQTHEVASGESVWGIARDYGMTSELLMKVNGIDDPRRLRVGQELRIPQADFSLVCDISTNELTLYNAGKFVKSYTVRTGRKPGTTPVGNYKILNKKEDPTWRPGDGRVYLPGDPNNELGTRWMAFDGDILGIHGTIRPETLGHYASNGCIGLSQQDVEELYTLVTIGTPLKIVGEQDLESAQVIPAYEISDPLSEREIAALQ